MVMNKNDVNRIKKILDFTLDYSSCNIKYRIYKEILKEPINSKMMLDLQEEILSLPKVKKCFDCQQDSGFFGNVLHGIYFDGFDSTIMLLKMNGVEITNSKLVKAKNFLMNWEDYEKDHFYKAGSLMDEAGRGGFKAILADQLVELGVDENHPIIQEQISNALNSFKGALNYSSVDDFTKKTKFNGKNCRYYLDNATFPAANHISILEKTLSWRTIENIEMVKKSFQHCKNIMKNYNDGFIYVYKGYFVGPFNYNWNDKSQIIGLESFNNHPIDFAWFMRKIITSTDKTSIFDEENIYEKDLLLQLLTTDNLLDEIGEEKLRLFKKYSSIEPSWRKKESIMCDIYFPLLLGLNKFINLKQLYEKQL